MKSNTFFGMKQLQIGTKIIATLFSFAIIIAAGMETIQVFMRLYEKNIDYAIQDGLFVLILLEMYYVVRSFIKYGSINISLIINVGIVAIVKEVIFKLEKLDIYSSIAFTLIFLGFCIGFFIENQYSQKRILQKNKAK